MLFIKIIQNHKTFVFQSDMKVTVINSVYMKMIKSLPVVSDG